MNPYVLLTGAITSELVGATALKLSAGSLKPLPSFDVVADYGLALYLVLLTLEEFPTGMVYRTRVVLDIVGAAAIGVVTFDKPVDLTGVASLLLTLAGIYCVSILSEMTAH